MAIVSTPAPVSGLGDLANESRMIATPWSRMVRGIGLGQYPVAYDPEIAGQIRHVFELLAARVSAANSYTLFARLLADLILTVEDPAGGLSRGQIERALGPIMGAIRAERNPYYRLMAGCILLDTFAKLDLDRGLLINEGMDFPAEVLAMTDEIRPDQIKDENSGRHGDYEKLSAYTAVFLALGQLGLAERLVAGGRDYVSAALNVLEKIPAPFFRGRGGSMLLSVISLLGYDAKIFDGDRDYMREILDYLDRADEIDRHPAFPQPMSDAFPKIYPLVTMLNAIAMSGRAEYLTYGRDRLAEVKELMAEIRPVERTHMGLYYVIALYNLGRLRDTEPDLNAFVDGTVGRWRQIDPGENFFLNGISYPYMIETAMITGRMDLITEETLDRLVAAFRDLDRTDEDRDNRPYPFSYALNILGEVGGADRLFKPLDGYGGKTPIAWVVDGISVDGHREGNRLYMLDHALISYALRLRGPRRRDTELFENFRFRLAENSP